MLVFAALAVSVTLFPPCWIGTQSLEDDGSSESDLEPNPGQLPVAESVCEGDSVLFPSFDPTDWKGKMVAKLAVDDINRIYDIALLGREDIAYHRTSEGCDEFSVVVPGDLDAAMKEGFYYLVGDMGVNELRPVGVNAKMSLRFTQPDAYWASSAWWGPQAVGWLKPGGFGGGIVAEVNGDYPGIAACRGLGYVFRSTMRLSWTVRSIEVGCMREYCFDAMVETREDAWEDTFECGDGGCIQTIDHPRYSAFSYVRDGKTHRCESEPYGCLGECPIDGISGYEVEFQPGTHRFLVLNYDRGDDDTCGFETALFRVSGNFEKLFHAVTCDP